MNKFCLVIGLGALFSLPAFAEANLAKVKEEKTYLRTDPNLESSVLLEIPKGEIVTIVEEKDDWKLIRTSENRVGWVKNVQMEDAKPPSTISNPAPSQESPVEQPSTREPTITDQEADWEFYEISLVLRPGFDKATDHPAGMDDTGFSIGGHVTWYLLPYLGLSIPYTFRYFEGDNKVQTVGAGPVLRYLDLNHFRGSVDANFLYARAFGHNEIGWNAGWDFTFGSREMDFRPFIGPFVRYEQIYADGPNLTTWSFGLSLSLSDFTDFD